MTQEQHPVTPPPELVKRWDAECESGNNPEISNTFDALQQFACKAARWGADQELEACANWLADPCAADMPSLAKDLRYSRRPEPPSLKEQALLALSHLEEGAEPQMDTTEATYTIRRALEALPDD